MKPGAWVPEHLRRIQPYAPGKPIEEVQRELGLTRVVKLASNESAFGPSPRALAAAQRALTESHRYPDAGGYYLREALAAFHRVPMDHIVLGAGSTELVQLLVWALLTPDDHAVIVDITFLMYRLALQVHRVPMTVVPLRDGHYDLNRLLDAIRPNTKIVFLANPNNPTGTYIPQSDWDAFLQALPEHVLVVYDEAYAEYVDRADYPSGLETFRQGYPVVVLRTFSKVYGLAGLRIGYAIAAKEIVRAINTVRSPFNVSHIAQMTALAALRDQEYVRAVVQKTIEQRAWLAQELTRRGWTPYPSVTNFLCVPVQHPYDWFQRLLRRGVIIRPLPPFGMANGVRITVGRPEENQYLIETLDHVLKEVKTHESAGTGQVE